MNELRCYSANKFSRRGESSRALTYAARTPSYRNGIALRTYTAFEAKVRLNRPFYPTGMQYMSRDRSGPRCLAAHQGRAGQRPPGDCGRRQGSSRREGQGRQDETQSGLDLGTGMPWFARADGAGSARRLLAYFLQPGAPPAPDGCGGQQEQDERPYPGVNPAVGAARSGQRDDRGADRVVDDPQL